MLLTGFAFAWAGSLWLLALLRQESGQPGLVGPLFALGGLLTGVAQVLLGIVQLRRDAPPVVAAVDIRDLGAEASALERTSGGLSTHRFSQAWGCAREVTAGRVTGLVSSSVDGTPALLVYTRFDGSTQVTVVTGCGGGTPSAGPSAVLPR